ncbi:MAG: aldehyde dehydrogenase family protein [Deltaproteobacteria bacterium]|nr:aldehyde dehydrogenase family protein [Deltaproteobacteria bacterium]
MSRLRIDKTLKLYVNGKFIRSESGRVLAVPTGEGRVVNVAMGSKKDLRNAVLAARKAQGGWCGKTAYNRGQILYRLAEMLDGRADALPTTKADAEAAVDRLVHYAGWADKITQVLSTLNPVSQTYVNYSRVRALGVVVAAPDPKDGLLGMVEAIGAATVMGNGLILLTDAAQGELAAALTEALHTSDFPSGVVNVFFGDQAELLGHASRHDDVDALYLAGAAPAAVVKGLEEENALVLRRVLKVASAAKPADPLQLQVLSEVQTVWMSAYESAGGGSAY